MKFKNLSFLLVFVLFSCEAEQIKPSEPVPTPEETPADSTEFDRPGNETDDENDSREIVEVGDHATLTKLRGKYFELVKNQLELGD